MHKAFALWGEIFLKLINNNLIINFIVDEENEMEDLNWNNR